MRRWCDLFVRLGAPLVPDDIRRDWLREWRAELAFTEARAAKRGKRLPGGSVWRAAGAMADAAQRCVLCVQFLECVQSLGA